MDKRLKNFERALLMTVAALLAAGAANAQTTTPPPKKAISHTKMAPAAPSVPALEPKAIELLKATSARLAAAHTVSFTAVEIFEHPSLHGHPLAYATRSDVTLQRPDKLRVLIAGDGPASEFYYDGKVMMAYAPAENLLAVADAPPTIDATLDAAYKLAGIYFPFTDLIVADPYKDMAGGLKLAYYVGQSHVIGGTTTDIVAYIDNGVFLQVWIGAEDKLPRMVHATFLDDPERMRHHLELSNWQIDAPASLNAFAPANAGTAKRMPFAHPHPQTSPGTGTKPKAKSTPSQ
jgi:hypothetical protein